MAINLKPEADKALAALSQGQPKTAYKIAKAALRKSGGEPFFNNLAGLALCAQSRQRDALPYFQKAVRANPDFVDAQKNLAQTLILLGDLNDGPGLDEYEDLFGRSSIEIIMGKDDDAGLFDPNARRALRRRIGAMPTTARFYIAHEKPFLQALLDYVMVSPDLLRMSPQWRIWHPFDDPECWRVPELHKALLTASDHFPVVLDIDI